MCEDSDQEVSELEIESRTWNKIERNMKLLGFREGAAKGRELSLQEGFNAGYSDGFKLGEYLGMVRGILSCESEMKLSPPEKCEFNNETVTKLSDQACVICSEKQNKASKKIMPSSSTEEPFKNFEELISAQQSVSNEIITTLKNLDLKKCYLEKG